MNLFANFSGWHVLILLGVILAMVAVVVVVVLIVLAVARRARNATPARAPAQVDVSEQLTNLDRLRSQGLVSEAEYEAKRAEILRRL